MGKNQLIEAVQKCNREIEAVEQVLNDGIDYGFDFVSDLHGHIAEQIKICVRAKKILVKKYGVAIV